MLPRYGNRKYRSRGYQMQQHQFSQFNESHDIRDEILFFEFSSWLCVALILDASFTAGRETIWTGQFRGGLRIEQT